MTSHWIEAECAEGGEEWQPDTTTSASHKLFVYFPGNYKYAAPRGFGGPSQLTFHLDLSETTDYTLFFRINSPEHDRNSVWVSIDDGPWVKFWRQRGREQLMTNGFEWREVMDDGRALDLNLVKGEHTVRVAARETGTQLDKICMAPAGQLPEGMGADAPSCPDRAASTLTTSSKPANFQTVQDRHLDIFPNPASDLLTVRLPSVTVGSRLLVLDATGRALRETWVTPLRDGRGQFTEVDIKALSAGTYTLILTDPKSETSLSQTFLKGE